MDMKSPPPEQEVEGLGSALELERRLAVATPADTFRGLLFQSVLEEMRELGEEAFARCLQACGETHFVSFYNYPASAMLRLLYAAAWQLAPASGGVEAAFARLGQRAARDFLGSVVGRMLLTLAGTEPRRLINGLPSAYQTAASTVHLEVRWLAHRHALVINRHDFMPHPYTGGALREVLAALSVKHVQVRTRQSGPLENEHEVMWG